MVADRSTDKALAYDLRDLPPQQFLDNVPDARTAYVLSKLISHRRSTEFVEQSKAHYDLIRVLPGYIQGANELYSSAEAMRSLTMVGSNEGTIRTALGIPAGHPRIANQVFLDDCARAHVQPLKDASIENMTNLLVVGSNGGSTPWSDVAVMIEKQYPDAVEKGVLKPGASDPILPFLYDVESSEKALGWKFAGSEKYVPSVVEQYLALANA